MPVGRRFLAGLVMALALGASPGATAAPKAGTTHKAAAQKTKAKAQPVTSALPPVALRVELTESGPDEQWRLKIENTSSVRVRVVDDLRLLWLEVAVKGEEKPRVCKLPAELLPAGRTDGNTEELGPGEGLVHRIDPRFYCFSPDKQETLVPSAQVTPHYGWPSKTKRVYRKGRLEEEKLPDVGPFVAEPTDPAAAGPAKNLTGNVVILDARYASWAADTATPDEDEGDEPALEMVRGSDARTELGVVATVRVRNPGRSKLSVFVRRELITFEVLTPRGTVACQTGPDKRNPARQAFKTLAPHASVTLVSRLVELCPRGTFAESGLYLIHARFDAAADGSDYDLEAFTGSLHTARPVPVRVRHTIRIEPNRTVGPPGAATMAAMAQPIPNQPQMIVPPPAIPAAPPPPPPPPPPTQ
jgi:hypothetical protein